MKASKNWGTMDGKKNKDATRAKAVKAGRDIRRSVKRKVGK